MLTKSDHGYVRKPRDLSRALFSTTVENKKRPIKLEVHMRFVMQHTMFVKSLDNVCLDLKG